MTDPYPYFSTKYGLSVDPPNSDILKGQDVIIIDIFLYIFDWNNIPPKFFYP